MSKRRTDPPEPYLWDRSGPVDEDVRRLEHLLGRYRLGNPPPLEDGDRDGAARPHAPRRRAIWPWAVAAGLVGVLVFQALDREIGHAAGYVVHGVPGRTVTRVGEWIVASEREHARIDIQDVGTVDLDPGTRVRIDAVAADRHRMFLAKGRLEAFVYSLPEVFGVGTPSGDSVDLGCWYNLEVDEASGATRLEVKFGAVAFESHGRYVYVPSGAVCRATRERGPSSPLSREQEHRLEDVVRLDFGQPDEGDVEWLMEGLESVTLWHLLGAESKAVRGRAFELLAALVPPPEDLDRAAVVEQRDLEERRRWLAEDEMDWVYR